MLAFVLPRCFSPLLLQENGGGPLGVHHPLLLQVGADQEPHGLDLYALGGALVHGGAVYFLHLGPGPGEHVQLKVLILLPHVVLDYVEAFRGGLELLPKSGDDAEEVFI